MWILLVPIFLLIAVIIIGFAALLRWAVTKSRIAFYTWVVCAVLTAVMLIIGYNY
ncbi:hypothetical protein [Brevibacillus sp. NRS-1366]|uniref:hypothetical protein n=1 Tax=Brevibacillus sp. NRS-1366 TaxID=3233899 RepID=UPI003D1E4E83